MAQTAIQQAIYRAARVAGLVPDSWTVILSVPYPGVTIYGDSLSAMVSLSVLALAKGETIPIDRVMTGSVSPDGRITPVGSIPLKVAAANAAHIRRSQAAQQSRRHAHRQSPLSGTTSLPVGRSAKRIKRSRIIHCAPSLRPRDLTPSLTLLLSGEQR